MEVKVGAFNVLSQGVSNCGTGFGELQESTREKLTPQSVFNDLNKFADKLRQMATQTTEPPQPSSSSSPEYIKKWTDSLLSPLNERGVRSWNVSQDHLLRALEELARVAPYFFNERRTQDIVFNELVTELSNVKTDKSEIAAIMSLLHGKILGLSLYGGFELGSNLTSDEDKQKLEKEKTKKTFQKNYFDAKRRFIENQIKDFFEGTSKGILVCTEFDYPIVTTPQSEVQSCPPEQVKPEIKGRKVLACDENDLTVKVEHNTYVPHGTKEHGETFKINEPKKFAIHDNECINLDPDLGLKYIRVGNKMNYTSDFVQEIVGEKKFDTKKGLKVANKILQASEGSPMLNANGNLGRVIIHKGFTDPNYPIDMLKVDRWTYKIVPQDQREAKKEAILNRVKDLLEVKKSLVVDLLLFEDNLVIVAVHLDSTTTFKSSKERESKRLLNLVKALEASGFKVIVSGDFNFPLYPKAAKGTPLYPDGFDQETIDTSETTDWDALVTGLNLKDPRQDPIVGVAQKKRFHDTIGNDQFWEGKLEKRSYNTDFVGVGPSTRDQHLQNNPDFSGLLMQQYHTNIKQLDENSYHPYVHYDTSNNNIDFKQSWLSDHILVHRTFTFSTELAGGARKLKRSKNRRKKGSKKSKKNRRNRRNIRNRK